jgi:hypothetical protein
MEIKIGLCLTCIQRNLKENFDEFSNQVLEDLKRKRPDIIWSTEGQSCFRFCPLDRIAMSVPRKENIKRGRASMSLGLTVDSVTSIILKENY